MLLVGVVEQAWSTVACIGGAVCGVRRWALVGFSALVAPNFLYVRYRTRLVKCRRLLTHRSVVASTVSCVIR